MANTKKLTAYEHAEIAGLIEMHAKELARGAASGNLRTMKIASETIGPLITQLERAAVAKVLAAH